MKKIAWYSAAHGWVARLEIYSESGVRITRRLADLHEEYSLREPGDVVYRAELYGFGPPMTSTPTVFADLAAAKLYVESLYALEGD